VASFHETLKVGPNLRFVIKKAAGNGFDPWWVTRNSTDLIRKWRNCTCKGDGFKLVLPMNLKLCDKTSTNPKGHNGPFQNVDLYADELWRWFLAERCLHCGNIVLRRLTQAHGVAKKLPRAPSR
jgi:hypothetical protein